VKFLIPLVVLLAVPLAAHAGESSDLDTYLQEIRASGMSESAAGAVRFVVLLRLGQMVLTYEWDETAGRYWPSYQSTNCPLPGADPEETAAWEEEQELARVADLAGVKGYADADGSGFVSTAEGRDFRYLIEYGYLAAQLLEEGKTSIQELAVASGLSEPAARSRLDAYLAVVERDKASGSTLFPEIPYAFSDGE
jgi:hypothetical protein